jgi:hypothetical protein
MSVVISLVEAPVDGGGVLEFLSAAESVGVDDFVGGGVAEEAGFQVAALPGC